MLPLLLTMLLLSACGGDKQGTLDKLRGEAKEIQNIEARSDQINSAEDAFNVLGDLNQSMKQVRDACLNLDAEYRETKETPAKDQMKKEFSQINRQIDQSLKTISKNLEPYKEKEEISRMLEKLREMMISK
jgi:hypothetical protein